VAVVQISKIQIRRGQKNSSSGVPQLSSAELAWAVDTQELFIGNGSVQEGTPYVGNTKILTEHDNILELASSYRFASDDPSITTTTPRALLGKLDEIEVSVADFGAVGDGSTDSVSAFENAFTELFRNANPDYKKVLKVPNGEYLFSSDLEIPSNAIIRGETKNGAVLNFDTNNIRFITELGSGLVEFSSSNRPENIEISNITIRRSSGQTVITGLKDASFINVKFKGEYSLGAAVTTLATEPAAVFWSNDLAGLKVDNITFEDCDFEYNSVSLSSSQTVVTETSLKFLHCKFFVNDTSIYVNGVSGQNNNWNLHDCRFEEIATQIFRSNNGTGTVFDRCDFKNCGNGTNTAATPSSSIIFFGENKNNLVVNCTSDRQQAAGVVTSELTAAVSEVYNGDYTQLINRNFSEIYLSNSFRPVAVFSALNNYIKVNYVLRLGQHIRYGILKFTLGDNIQKISFTDEYQFSDSSLSSEGGKIMSNFEFDVSVRDNDDNTGDSANAPDTIVLYYKNPNATGQTGNFSFDVSYGV
jgi:hypothetical protein